MEEQTGTKQTISDGNRQGDALPNDLGEDMLLTHAHATPLRQEALLGGDASLQQYSSPLPDGLKTKMEALSGLSLDDVTVHYNSPRPAQLHAVAYTDGSEIYLGPGQEQHLAHEAWHVVQQRQGRVRPTGQHKGALINTDPELEREAQSMARLLAYVQDAACFSTVGSLAVPVSALLSQRPSPLAPGPVIQCVLEVAVATGKDDRPIYESAASALGVIELEGLKCRDTTLRKAYQVVSVSVEKGLLTLEDLNARGTFYLYTIATGVYSRLESESRAFSDEVKKKEVKAKDSSEEEEEEEEESFSMPTATAVNPQEYTVGVLGFLYHGSPLRTSALSASPSGIGELTQIMTEIRGKQKAVFLNMFAPPPSSIPINESVPGRHVIRSVQNMAEAWLGQRVSNPQAESQRSISTSQGAILLQFRPFTRKEGSSTSLGTEVQQANLEISVRPSSSGSWTKIVDLHIDPS